MTTAELVGHNIRRLRKTRGLKQATLAAMCGYSAKASGTISKIERGQIAIDVNGLGRIAQALEVDLPDLFQAQPLAETGTSPQKDIQPPVFRTMGSQFLGHPPDETLESIIIQGHFAIEKKLFRVVSTKVPFSEAIKDQRLGYCHLVPVMKVLFYRPAQEWLWEGVEQLNKLRNILIQAPTSKELESQIKKFLKSVEGPSGRLTKHARTDLADRIRSAVFVAIWALDSLLDEKR